MRKRHIGNDIVTIVFQEPGSVAFTPEAITSQFQHVFIIVKAHNPNTEKVAYRYADCNFYQMYHLAVGFINCTYSYGKSVQ